MQIKSIVAISLAAFAGAQSSSSSNATPSASSTSAAPVPSPTKSPLEACFIKNNCGNDVNCQAGCAGVPNPSSNQANAINNCVTQCNNTQPIEIYTACQAKCISQMVTSQTVPSSSVSNSKSGGSSGSGTSGAAQTQIYASAVGALTLFAMYVAL